MRGHIRSGSACAGCNQLLPVLAGIDMCNHAFGEAANCTISPTPGGVSLVTRRALAAGEECFIDYGALSNDFLLLDYVRLAPNCHNGTDRMLLGVVASQLSLYVSQAALLVAAPLGCV